MLRTGDPAPDVTLALHDGSSPRLAELWNERAVVLFFYPRDGTSICTKEACAFRDSYEKFVASGATVVGISGNTGERHRAFAEEHRLPFLLASDRDGSLRRAFGVPNILGMVPQRATFVIDRSGTVRAAFRALFAAEEHVQAALAAMASAHRPEGPALSGS